MIFQSQLFFQKIGMRKIRIDTNRDASFYGQKISKIP
jgi:hypothetical protein